MIEHGVVGNVSRVEPDRIVVRLPGDDIVISIERRLESAGSDYDVNDQVLLLSTQVNRWIIVGKLVDV